ncbi:MAG: sulfurtransferase complex subunit TusB [Pseudomonadota bacterium]|nr:MAG: sulfurtransferase complex subunit TusB [Pseudomonadota bacterium]
MALLHTVNKSPFERNAFDACLANAKSGSAVLLMEDGVYAAVKGTPAAKKLGDAMKSVKVYVLGPDVDARGMTGKLIDGVQSVDYGGFVDLVTQHNAVESWL